MGADFHFWLYQPKVTRYSYAWERHGIIAVSGYLMVRAVAVMFLFLMVLGLMSVLWASARFLGRIKGVLAVLGDGKGFF